MDLDQLLLDCESDIERHLLRALYPNLGPDAQAELQPQYMIDYYDIPATLPPFAARLVAAVVLMILVKSIFPTLFYYLTSGL